MVQPSNVKISELPALTTPGADVVVPVVSGGTTYKITPGNLLKGRESVFNVRDYGASGLGSSDDSAAFVAANALAAAVGGTVYMPAGTYNVPTFAMSSGVTLRGDGDASILLNCYLTCTGTAGSERVLTSAAAKGATTLSLSTTGLAMNTWLRLASIVNSQSTDAGADQLGHSTADYSSFAEYVQVATVGGSSVTIFSPTFFAYSNTPGADSNPTPSNQVSVARAMTFHDGGRLSKFKMLGKNSGQNNNIHARFCRDLVIEDVNIDTNDLTAQSVLFDYCLDCKMLRGSVTGKKTSVPPGSTADPCNVLSSQRVVFHGVRVVNGRQGFFISYRNNDNTNRGGPSLACGAVSCTAVDCDLDAFTSVWGCRGSFFIDCTNWGCTFGFRMRDRACQVIGCRSFSMDLANGAGILVDQAAVIDALISNNTIVGHVQGIQLDNSLAGYAPLQALLLSSGALISDNQISDCGDHGVYANLAYTAASLVGPRIINNEINNVLDDGIQVNSYWNGTILDGNRVNGTLATKTGIRYQANIKRLWIGTNYVYGIAASTTALTGAGVSTFMTDATTFPGGEAEAQLYIGELFTDCTAGFDYGGVIRNAAAYYAPAVAGWQPFRANLGAAAPSLTRSMIGAWLDADGHFRLSSLDGTAAISRQYVAVIRQSGTPEASVSSAIGGLCIDSATGILYAKTSGTGNTGWEKVSAT